jgi:1,2-diacylglycerol 3-alpha-glucosyltransferase
MRVVITTDAYWPRINGVTVVVDGLRRHLVAAGHEVYVLAPTYPPHMGTTGLPDPPGVLRFSGFPFPFSKEDRMGWPVHRYRITRIMEDLRPDIVHSHSEFTIGFSGKTYCRRFGVPHLMTRHTMYEDFIQAYVPGLPYWLARAVVSTWSRSDYRLINRVVVPARHLKDLILSYGITTPVEVIPNGIDLKELSLTEDERRLQAQRLAPLLRSLKGKKILIHVGRIAHEKNIDFLVRSFAHVHRAFPDAVLLLVGDGPYRLDLQRQVEQDGRADCIRFAGYLDRQAVAYMLAVADLFVFASKTEVHPLVLIEAMSCGAPIVAVNARGTDEILLGASGVDLVPEDEMVFAERVSAILADPSLRQKRSAEVREAAKSWSLERMAERTLGLYLTLLKAQAPDGTVPDQSMRAG